MAETPIEQASSETSGDEATARPAAKARKERIHGKSQDRMRQDILEDRSIDDAIKESIRLHGA